MEREKKRTKKKEREHTMNTRRHTAFRNLKGCHGALWLTAWHSRPSPCASRAARWQDLRQEGGGARMSRETNQRESVWRSRRQVRARVRTEAQQRGSARRDARDALVRRRWCWRCRRPTLLTTRTRRPTECGCHRVCATQQLGCQQEQVVRPRRAQQKSCAHGAESWIHPEWQQGLRAPRRRRALWRKCETAKRLAV